MSSLTSRSSVPGASASRSPTRFTTTGGLFALVLGGLVSSGCAKPAMGTARDPNTIVRPSNVAPESRLTPQQLEHQKELRRMAAERHVTIQRGGYVKEDEQKCTADADCTLVAMHCCSCDYKGQLVGINRNHIPQLAVRRTGVCQTYQCIAQKSDHESCSAKKAVCREGMCVPDISGAPPAPAGIGVEPIAEEDEGAEGNPAP